MDKLAIFRMQFPDNATFLQNLTRMFGFDNVSLQDYDFLYEGFAFERPIFLFIWQVLALIITLENAVVIIIFLRRSQRSSTTRILIAIAVAETLSILVTLPSYVYVYQQLENGVNGASDVYVLSLEWCRVFMFSKLFLSQTFHTASLWLHCMLSCLRCISVWMPLRSSAILTRTRIFWTGVGICLLVPAIHFYHIFNDKASVDGMCIWRLENPCAYGCAYMWYSMILVHVLPCIVLLVLTGLLIFKLFQSTTKMSTKAKNRPSIHLPEYVLTRRSAENRAVTKVVVSAVVVLLVPEVPYTILLAFNVALRHRAMDLLPLRTNRALQASYELLLSLSYCANFWIYVILNKTFRGQLRALLRMKK